VAARFKTRSREQENPYHDGMGMRQKRRGKTREVGESKQQGKVEGADNKAHRLAHHAHVVL